MARQKSEFVSALGTAFEIFKAIAEKVYALGGSDSDLRRILKEPALCQQVAKLIVLKIGEVYQLDVRGSIGNLVRLGNYNWANADISDQHFSADTPHTVNVIIEYFGKDMNMDGALKALAAKGLRPVTISELLALGAKYPDLQCDFPIVALGSLWYSQPGLSYVAYLGYHEGQRELLLHCTDRDWHVNCRFAAVRK